MNNLYNCFARGAQAHQVGTRKGDNPFPISTYEGLYWDLGWTSAQIAAMEQSGARV